MHLHLSPPESHSDTFECKHASLGGISSSTSRPVLTPMCPERKRRAHGKADHRSDFLVSSRMHRPTRSLVM